MEFRKTSKWLTGFGVVLGSSLAMFGQVGSVTSVSAANYRNVVAPDSIVSAWGTGLAMSTVSANTNSVNAAPITLPTTLGSTTLAIRDARNNPFTPALYLVSPGQINYVTAATTALGVSMLTVNSGTSSATGRVFVSNVAPALFTADGSGNGVPVGNILRVTRGGVVSNDTPFQPGSSTFVPKAINLSTSPTDTVYIILYGTGIRNRNANTPAALIGGVKVPVQYAGSQSQYPGFDQVNLGPLPQTLVGKGQTDLVLTVDGVPSNTVRLAIQ